MAVGFSAAASLFFFATTTSLCAIASPYWRGAPAPPQQRWPNWNTPPTSTGAPGWPYWNTPPAPGWPYWNAPPTAAGGAPSGWPYGGPPASGGGASCSCSSSNTPPVPPPKVIVVGGNDKWRYGFNYTDWAIKLAGTFYVNDVLEFDYPLPVAGRFFNHSVHLLANYSSFQRCDLTDSVRVGNEYSGGAGGGFKFQLGMKPAWDPYYYFACGERNGFHCNNGTMKFAVMPILRWG